MLLNKWYLLLVMVFCASALSMQASDQCSFFVVLPEVIVYNPSLIRKLPIKRQHNLSKTLPVSPFQWTGIELYSIDLSQNVPQLKLDTVEALKQKIAEAEKKFTQTRQSLIQHKVEERLYGRTIPSKIKEKGRMLETNVRNARKEHDALLEKLKNQNY